MEQQISISESEWQGMKIIWNDSPRTLPEILDKLKETAWSKTTIQTYLAFVSVMGSVFTAISLFINHVLRCTLPLWFALFGMLFFCVPFLSPNVVFISPETQDWVHGYRIASMLWAWCMVPLVKANLVSALPVSLFVSFCSAALPGMINLRLFYLLAALLFGVNAAYVGSANPAPFYMITSGDLIRLIWGNPK